MQALNFAHRGASHHAPENTLSAFRLARTLGADGVELDVRLSQDGVVVVVHDATVDRTTDGTGAVADLTLAELRELDAGSWFSPHFAGEHIPTLVEVLETAGQDLLLNLELKATGAEMAGLAEAVVSLIANCSMDDQVLISSFNPQALELVCRINAHLPLALLYGSHLSTMELEHWASGLPSLIALHPEYHLVDADHLARARTHNWRVHTWTVDAPTDMRRLVALGVDGIITNRPDLLRSVLKGADR